MDNRLRPESKKHIIRCAHKVLLRDGAAHFSIRQVARECDCSVAGLYRHFSSRDELLVYASLMSLDSYYKTLAETVKPNQSSISNYFEVERIFAKHSFTQPELFYNIYFSMPEGRCDEILFDSFNLFENSPEELFKIQFGKSFIGGGIFGRNLAMLEICHKDGFITINKEELPLFNECVVNMYRGFLDMAIVMKNRGEDISTIAENYLEAHRLLHQPIISLEKYS